MADGWLEISGSNWVSDCGSTDGRTNPEALSGTDSWQHDTDHTHEFILDLGENGGKFYTLSKFKGRSNSASDSDPIDVDIYISETNGNWSTPVVSGISNWLNSDAWVEAAASTKAGRFIKVEIVDTENNGALIFGNSASSFQIFDAYGFIYINMIATSDGISNVSGELDSQQGLQGSLTATTVLSSTFAIEASEVSVIGTLEEVTGVSGNITNELELAGISEIQIVAYGAMNIESEFGSSAIEVVGVSAILSDLSVTTELIGTITATENIADIELNRQQGFESSASSASNIDTAAMDLPDLFGYINATSDVADCLLPFRVLGFYETLSNDLAAYFQTNIAEDLNIQVRYDNDPRETPTDSIWMEYTIDYGSANQFEIGINSSRHIGNINIKLKVNVGIGTGKLLDVVDRVVTAFKVVEISNIIFKVPRVVNVGRVIDDYQMNVICPFFVDE